MQMLEAYYLLTAMDQFTMICALGAVGLAFWLIRSVIGSTALAVVSAPVLIIGALAANYLFQAHFVIAANDKDTNVVVASAVGVLIAMILMLIGIWVTVIMADIRQKNKGEMTMPELPPAND